ncbi:MAG: MerR family transcriptional regulator [Caldilineaceae bacterium]
MSTEHVATKRTFLYIKEVADLFGITTKTVRHYHKIGLLPEPERSEADYRLYSGRDLWRLRTICELRSLGLPLAQIRAVLQAPKPADALRLTLAAQLDEIEMQLVELAEHKERIEDLMTQETINVQQVNGEPELYIDQALAQYANLIPTELDPSLLQFEREMERLMATFPEHDTRDETIPPLMTYIEEHPEQYRRLMHDYNQAWVQLDELGALDEDGKEKILRLADSLIEHNREILQVNLRPPAPTSADSPVTAALGAMTDEKLQAILTPAQHYFLKCLGSATDEMRVG